MGFIMTRSLDHKAGGFAPEIIIRRENNLVFAKRVNWHTSIDFSKKLYGLTSLKDYNEIVIDFSNVSRAYPNGMVPIIAKIASETEKGRKFILKPPKNIAVRFLFQHSGWLHYIDPINWEPPKTSSFASLPLQRFHNDEELNDIVNKSVEVCLQQLVFAEGVPQAFEWALNEIAGNVLVHSEAESGWVQVVTYKENHKLALIVCDSGIGIPRAMRAMYDIKTDQAALEMAMRPGITSKPKFGQGNGLAGALAIAQYSKGMFALTSSRGRVRVLDGKVEPQRH